MADHDTEQGTPTIWDNAWREGHAHGLMNALGIPYHDAWQRTAAMLRGEKLNSVPRLLYPGEQCPRCGTIALYPGGGTQDTPGLGCENAFSDWMENTYLPEDENAHAVAHEAYCASWEIASVQAAASERRRIAGAIRRNMTHTPLSSWATGWLDAAAWIERDMPGADLSAEPVAADTSTGDSDTQPDPYIDTLAAQHIQEFEPDDQDGDHG